MTVTPETLTFEHIKQWNGAEMKRHMAHPEMREAISRIVRERTLAEVEAVQTVAEPESELPVEKTAEELAAEEEQARLAEEETQRVAAEQEAARKAAEPKKFVIDYQVKDEDGNAIGRPTHLEAPTQEELIEKMKEAHVQATRAFHRLKKQKISFKEPVAPVTAPSSDAELLEAMKDLRSDDPQKQLEAIRKVQKVESDKSRAEADKKQAEADELRRQEQVSRKFLSDHKKDFNPCQANIELIKNYFLQEELPWTSDNLEICFHALESELASVVEPVASVVPANPVRTVTPDTTQVAPLVVQPVTPTPAQVSATVNPVAATPRPGVNGGIVPGQSSGRPTTTTPKGLTAEEIKSWDGPTMKAKMRDPRVRPLIDAFFATRAAKK